MSPGAEGPDAFSEGPCRETPARALLVRGFHTHRQDTVNNAANLEFNHSSRAMYAFGCVPGVHYQ